MGYAYSSNEIQSLHIVQMRHSLCLFCSLLTVNEPGRPQKVGILHLKNLTNKYAHEKGKYCFYTFSSI